VKQITSSGDGSRAIASQLASESPASGTDGWSRRTSRQAARKCSLRLARFHTVILKADWTTLSGVTFSAEQGAEPAVRQGDQAVLETVKDVCGRARVAGAQARLEVGERIVGRHWKLGSGR
jgi:hypothetical protein